MGKSSGLGDQLYIGGYDLSGDVGSLSGIRTPIGVQDTTGIDKYGHERIALQRDGGLDFTAFYNDTAAHTHPVLSTLPTTDRIVSYFRGIVPGKNGAGLVCKQLNYDPDRGDSGELTIKISMTANGFGLEWGTLMTAGLRTDTAGTNGTPVDFGASSAFGLQAYLQVNAIVGTNLVVKLQESSDNAGDAYADVVGGAFTSVLQAAAPTAARIATASGLSVERWLRVVTSGTFSSATFSVIVVRNPISVAF
jgi:hypothetical protein